MKTVLISLSTNSIICVISELILTNCYFSSLCVTFSCLFFFFFAYLFTFYWILDTVNFILLGARYFCVSINTLELSSGMKLLLATV